MRTSKSIFGRQLSNLYAVLDTDLLPAPTMKQICAYCTLPSGAKILQFSRYLPPPPPLLLRTGCCHVACNCCLVACTISQKHIFIVCVTNSTQAIYTYIKDIIQEYLLLYFVRLYLEYMQEVCLSQAHSIGICLRFAMSATQLNQGASLLL